METLTLDACFIKWIYNFFEKLYVCWTLTQSELLPGVRGQREAQHRHGGDQQTRHDQVREVVECPPADLDDERDVQIRLRVAFVDNLIPLSWDT